MNSFRSYFSLSPLGAVCGQESWEGQECLDSLGRGVRMIPRREVGQLEMLHVLQELLEGDEEKLKSVAKSRKLVSGNSHVRVRTARVAKGQELEEASGKRCMISVG